MVAVSYLSETAAGTTRSMGWGGILSDTMGSYARPTAQGPLSGRGMMGSILEPMLMIREVTPGGRERGARDFDRSEACCCVVALQSLAMLSKAVL